MIGRSKRRGYLTNGGRGSLRKDRRRPAFFLEALLSKDIPPYLTNQRGVKLDLSDDRIADAYQRELDIDPASL